MIFFCTSPIGLGHATRDIAIAEKLYKLEKSKEKILFITGQYAYSLISKKGYCALDLYKPEKLFIGSEELHHPFKWLVKYVWYYRKCKIAAENIINKEKEKKDEKYDGVEHNSDLIVSDEDFASIAVAEKMNIKRILITDVTETHFTKGGPALAIEKIMNRSMHKMMSKCNFVIIPDFGTDEDNVIHVGPIVREVSADRSTLRKELGFNKQTILVSVGGTDAGKYLIEKSIEAYRKLKKKLDIDLVIVSGPSIKLTMNNSADFRNVGFIDNLHEYIYASDLIISLAGRSTMDESMVYRVPGIFIPIKNHFEQEKGAGRLGYKYEDIFRLEHLIQEKLCLSSSNVNDANIQMDTKGAENAARLILETL
jgi:UDP-N-acetylglucosamine--N-acetylmuramyl-(pentapeptide) pyrophosphoryl-undecaprenol N-acetylglucosamine transferase